MSEYKVKASTLIFTWGFLAVLTLLILFGALFAEPRIFFIVFLVYPAWRWYQILRTPVRIRLLDSGAVELHSFIRRLVLEPQQIKTVRRIGGGYWLDYEGGSISLYGNIPRFDELVLALKRSNPAIQVRGLHGLAQR